MKTFTWNSHNKLKGTKNTFALFLPPVKLTWRKVTNTHQITWNKPFPFFSGKENGLQLNHLLQLYKELLSLSSVTTLWSIQGMNALTRPDLNRGSPDCSVHTYGGGKRGRVGCWKSETSTGIFWNVWKKRTILKRPHKARVTDHQRNWSKKRDKVATACLQLIRCISGISSCLYENFYNLKH